MGNFQKASYPQLLGIGGVLFGGLRRKPSWCKLHSKVQISGIPGDLGTTVVWRVELPEPDGTHLPPPRRTTFSLPPTRLRRRRPRGGGAHPRSASGGRYAGQRARVARAAGAARRAAEGSRVRRLPEVRGEEAKKVDGGGEERARAGCGRGREVRTGTGTRARAGDCRAAPTAGGLLCLPRALPRGPQNPASRPCAPSRRRPPALVLPGRVGREPPAPRGNRRLPARRGGAAAAACADRGRARASEGWVAARGAERPGSCHLRLRDPPLPGTRACPGARSLVGAARRTSGVPRSGAMEPRAPGAGRPETRPRLRPRAAGSPR